MKIKALAKTVGATLWEHRADIEFITGTGLVMAGSVVAMTKAEDAVEVKHEYEDAKKRIELKDENDDWDDNKQRSKACFDATKNAVVGYGKVYALPIGMQAAGFTLQTIAHKSQKAQITTLTTNLAAEVAAFAAYRQNVRDEEGAEKDEKYLLGNKAEVVDADGKVSINEDALPLHTIAFTRDNPYWSEDPGMNYDFVENQQIFLNMRLQKEGVLYENDIRRALKCKVDPSAEGYGITAVDDNGNTNYIDLGINRDTGRAAAFRDGTPTEMIFVLNNMEPKVNTKLYRLMKYHRDWDCELHD